MLKKKLQEGRVGYARVGNFRNFQEFVRYLWGLGTALENHGEG